MKQEEKILEKYGKDSGMKVPEGYFSELNSRIMDQLPPYEVRRSVPQLSSWQRVRPYIYLAAMFCGIWLMMKLFHSVSQPMSLSLDNPPEALVYLIERESDLPDMNMMPMIDDYMLEEDVVMSYDSFAEFQEDFDSIE